MRVMCVNEKWVKNPVITWDVSYPSYGDVDTVVREEILHGNLFYVLERFGDYAYRSDCFIPLSDEPEEIEDAECEVLETATA